MATLKTLATAAVLIVGATSFALAQMDQPRAPTNSGSGNAPASAGAAGASTTAKPATTKKTSKTKKKPASSEPAKT